MGGTGPGQPCPSAALLLPLEVPSWPWSSQSPGVSVRTERHFARSLRGTVKCLRWPGPALSELLEPWLSSPGAAWVPLPPHRSAGGTGLCPGRRAVLRVTCLALVSSSGPGPWHPCLPRLHEGLSVCPWPHCPQELPFSTVRQEPQGSVPPGGWLLTVPGRAINTLAAAVLPGLFSAPVPVSRPGLPPHQRPGPCSFLFLSQGPWTPGQQPGT